MIASVLLAPTLIPSTPFTVVNPLYAPVSAETVTVSVDELIVEKAAEYNVSASLMRAVIRCESHYRNGQSEIPDITGPNGREDSWGYVQIHLPDWPLITREQALDPEFAVNFLAEKLSKNEGYLWTCWRNMQ